MDCISELIVYVEQKIASDLLEKVAIVFAGYSSDSTHCIAVSVSFKSMKNSELYGHLLGFCLVEDRTDLGFWGPH